MLLKNQLKEFNINQLFSQLASMDHHNQKSNLPIEKK
jgi:hypothetical protein